MDGDWARTYFDEVYLHRWELTGPGQPEIAEATSVLRLLAAPRGGRLLDVGCGQGRYSIAFAALGMQVTGSDSSAPLLAEAERLAGVHGVDVRWLLADMRTLETADLYDHVVLMDAFGFFASPAEDLQALQRVRALLRPDGTALIKIINGEKVRAQFRPSSSRRVGDAEETIDSVLLEGGRVLHEQLTLTTAGRQVSSQRFQRLYSPDELTSVIDDAGFQVSGLYRDPDGGPLDATADKIFALLRR